MTEIVVAVDTEGESSPQAGREPVQTARVFAPRADREFGRSLIESLRPAATAERAPPSRTAEAPVRDDAEPSSTSREVPLFLRNLASPPQVEAQRAAKPTPDVAAVNAGAIEPEGDREIAGDSRATPRSPRVTSSEHGSADTPDAALDAARARELVDMVRAELASMRQEIALSRQVESFPPGGALNAALQPLAGAMAAAGAPIGLRTLLLDQVRECDDLHDAVDQMKRQLAATLASMPKSDRFEGIQVIAGPSGAGKTQMLCRIAARHVAVQGASSVAILSFSDNRIGAWTQLQMLASRLGVDCFRVNTAELLGPMLSELDSRTLILIDTASAGFAEKLDSIRRCAPKALFNLVMPADASISSISRFVPAAPVTWHSVMVSKLDESAGAWQLVFLEECRGGLRHGGRRFPGGHDPVRTRGCAGEHGHGLPEGGARRRRRGSGAQRGTKHFARYLGSGRR